MARLGGCQVWATLTLTSRGRGHACGTSFLARHDAQRGRSLPRYHLVFTHPAANPRRPPPPPPLLLLSALCSHFLVITRWAESH